MRSSKSDGGHGGVPARELFVTPTKCVLLSVFFSALSFADCIPFSEARNHIGEIQCVTGKVFRVIGDVRQLKNQIVEIHGDVKEYNGRAEIVLEQLRQLGGEGVRILRLPKDYDVERKGKYSAGTFSLPKPT